MATSSPPSTFRAWQYTSTSGGISKNLNINASVPLPKAKPNEHIVKIIAAALNPVDYKPAEIPLVGRLITGKNATPCSDFSGIIVTPATNSSLKAGQLIFGVTGKSPLAGGGLSEYATIDETKVATIPEGIDPIQAAGVGIAGLTAYQTIIPYAKKGDKIFINGGSGGTGLFGIQIAKAIGCHVTTSCSTANVELCRSVGADEVFDYKKGDLVEQLIASGQKYVHVIDNVGKEASLYWRSHEYTTTEAKFVIVGGEISLHAVGGVLGRIFRPGMLGGGKRQLVGYFTNPNSAELEKLIDWMKQGKVKTVVDEKFDFEQAREAFDKLKTGRAKGKIIVVVDSKFEK